MATKRSLRTRLPRAEDGLRVVGALNVQSRDFNGGARGDGSVDDTAAWQEAADAIPDNKGGTLIVPTAGFRYKLTAPIQFKPYTTIMGWGSGISTGSQIHVFNDVSDIFDFTVGSGMSWVSIQNLSMRAGGGRCMLIDSAAFFRLIGCTVSQQSLGYPALEVTDLLLDSMIADCSFFHGASAAASGTVPTLKLVSTNNALSLLRIIRNRFTYSGNYSIWIENVGGGGYAGDSTISDNNFEVPAGGAIKLLTAHNLDVHHNPIYDLHLAPGGLATKDLVYVGQSPSSVLPSRNTRISKWVRRSGALDTGVVDIRLEASKAPNTVVEAAASGTGSGLVIDWGSNLRCAGRDMDTGVTHQNVRNGYPYPPYSIGAPVLLKGTATINPASLAAGAVQTFGTVTVTGARVGDVVTGVGHSVSLGGTRIWGEVTATDTVTVYQQNPTAGAVDVASGTTTVRVEGDS